MIEAEPAPAPQAGSAPALVDGVDVDAVASAVTACSSVAELYSTPGSSIASYLPGRQIAGVRVDSRAVSIQVRSRWGIPVTEVAAQVRSAVGTLVGGRAVDVMIADITDAPATTEELAWTRSSDAGAERSSARTTPTAAAILPPSPPV